jgi:2-dehydro-3-deoxygluconokinase
MHKALDIVALGEGMVEFNQTTPGQPHYLQGFGGDTSNAVIAAARAGARTAYVSAVGNDYFGQQLLDLWQKDQVNRAWAAIDSVAPTGIYFVTHSADGHAFHYRRAGSAAAVMRMSAEQINAVESAQILHLSGISLAISQQAQSNCFAAMHAARAAGTQVSLDCNLRLKLWPLETARTVILQAMALCDIFLPSLDDATTLSGLHNAQDIIAWGHHLGAKMVVLKLGADGAIVSDGRSQEHITAIAVHAVDATGAGDCFAGNFLARLAAGDTPTLAARYANAAAALSVQGFGAVAPLPYPQAVHALLQTVHAANA